MCNPLPRPTAEAERPATPATWNNKTPMGAMGVLLSKAGTDAV
ncbi:hypothetical protein DWUX_421 [Desulfovibrio diazotrophicus]|nr:hypothetical protein DWUX_421 [Desulfovibrio diazotrophicus]